VKRGNEVLGEGEREGGRKGRREGRRGSEISFLGRRDIWMSF